MKSPFNSKTLWFNALNLLALALVGVTDSSIIADNPMLVAGLAVATSLVNVGLRYVTKTSIR